MDHAFQYIVICNIVYGLNEIYPVYMLESNLGSSLLVNVFQCIYFVSEYFVNVHIVEMLDLHLPLPRSHRLPEQELHGSLSAGEHCLPPPLGRPLPRDAKVPAKVGPGHAQEGHPPRPRVPAPIRDENCRQPITAHLASCHSVSRGSGDLEVTR